MQVTAQNPAVTQVHCRIAHGVGTPSVWAERPAEYFRAEVLQGWERNPDTPESVPGCLAAPHRNAERLAQETA